MIFLNDKLFWYIFNIYDYYIAKSMLTLDIDNNFIDLVRVFVSIT